MTDLRKVSKMKFPFLDAKAKLIRIMGTFDLATGHGDTMDELLDSLESELRDVLGHYREALRQALAQPEQEQKTPLKVLNLTVFTENRLRNGRVYDVETLQAMTSRDILAIPDIGKKALKEVMEALDVYAVNMSQERVDETAKCKREWVGLTRRELDIATLGLEDLGDCYKAIEAKLKEKNT